MKEPKEINVWNIEGWYGLSVITSGEDTYRICEQPRPPHEQVQRIIQVPFHILTHFDLTKEIAHNRVFEEIYATVTKNPEVTRDLKPNIFLLMNSATSGISQIKGCWYTTSWGCLFGELTHIPPWLISITFPLKIGI